MDLELKLNEIWNFVLKIFQCWPVKALASTVVTVFTFLVGEIQAPFIALWVLVAIDTVTRWAAISKRVLEEQQRGESLLYGCYLAWKTGALNSKAMRQKFVTKVIAYFVMIVAANLVTKTISSITILNANWTRLPVGFVYSFLAVTEGISILENMLEMGFDAVKPVIQWFYKKRNEMTGGGGQP